MRRPFACLNLYEDDEYYWFSAHHFNGFYRMSKETMVAELLFHFPDEELTAVNLYSNIAKVGEYLVLVPTSAKNIFVYHPTTQETRILPLKEPNFEGRVKYNSDLKFIPAVAHESCVYCLPLTYPAIIKLDVETMELTYLEQWIPMIEPMILKGAKQYLGPGAVIGGAGYFPFRCFSGILKLDFDTERFKFEVVQTDEEQAWGGMCYHDGNFWVNADFSRKLHQYNQITHECLTFPFLDQGVEELNLWLLHAPRFYKDMLYFLPAHFDKAFAMDVETKKIETWNLFQEVEHPRFNPFYKGPKTYCPRIVENCLHYIDGASSDWVCINLETQEITVRSPQIDDVGQKLLELPPFYRAEDETITLDQFCTYLIGEPEHKNLQTIGEKTAGERILEKTT